MNESNSDGKGTERVARNEDGQKPRSEAEIEADASEPQEPQGTGFTALLRQMMQRSPQGDARNNVKREQLKLNRTKSFLFLAGFTVVLALAFFAMFSSSNSAGRRDAAQNRRPNLGRGTRADNPDQSHSVTPLLNADTRRQDDDPGRLSEEDVHNTAKQRMLAQASPSFGPPPEPPPPPPRPEA